MNFIVLILLASFGISAGKLYKKMNFGTSWTSRVYKNLTGKVQSSRECVALCATEAGACNVAFYDKVSRVCYFGDLSSNLGNVDSTEASYGFVDLGKLILEQNLYLLADLIHNIQSKALFRKIVS